MAVVKPTLQDGTGQGYSNPVQKTTTPAPPTYTQAQIDEIKRKAQNGIALVNPTAEKSALYNSFKTNGAANPAQSNPFDQNAYTQQMMDQSKGYLDNIYNQQKEAQLGQFRAQRDKAIGQINQQKAELSPQYQGMRNQADVVNMQNVQRLREVMANAGLTSSGENVSANVAANNQRLNSINSLNLQEQQANNDFDRRISDLNNPAEENAMIAALEAQRSQSLYDAFNRSQDAGYQRYRDSVGDSRYADETAYNRGRDAIGDQRYNAETAYNHGRDKVADSQWSQQFNYGKQRDQVGDKQWQQQFNYQAGRDKTSDAQWKAQFDEDVRRYGIDYAMKQAEQAHNFSMDAQQLALSKQKEARIASGKDDNGNPITSKPKSQTNSYNDGISFWADKKAEVKKHGAYAIEQSILNDPEAIKEIRSQGYDINSYIDSLYYVATDGKFATKKAYQDFVNENY